MHTYRRNANIRCSNRYIDDRDLVRGQFITLEQRLRGGIKCHARTDFLSIVEIASSTSDPVCSACRRAAHREGIVEILSVNFIFTEPRINHDISAIGTISRVTNHNVGLLAVILVSLRLPTIPVADDHDTDELVYITGISNMKIGLFQAYHAVNNLDVNITRFQRIRTELAGLPFNVILSIFIKLFAKLDGMGNLRSIRSVLRFDAESDFQGNVFVNLLRDKPEGQRTVVVVEIKSVSC